MVICSLEIEDGELQSVKGFQERRPVEFCEKITYRKNILTTRLLREQRLENTGSSFPKYKSRITKTGYNHFRLQN